VRRETIQPSWKQLRPRGSSDILPAAAAATTGILVGSSIVATRFVIAESNPLSLAFLRYVIGLAFLLPAVLARGPVLPERRDVLPIGLLGIAQFGILVLLLNYALASVSAARVAVIFASMPLLALVIGSALGYERLTTPKTLALLLTLLGVGMVLGDRGAHGVGETKDWLGDLAAVGSALVGALCSVLYRPYLTSYPLLTVASLAMLVSVGFLGLLVAGRGILGNLLPVAGSSWQAIVFIGASSGLGYFLWLWALARSTPARVAAFLSLSPITAAAFGVLVLGETPTAPVVAGLSCVVIGLLSLTIAKERPDSSAEARRS